MPRQLRLIRIEGDGDCFFNAVIQTARHHPHRGRHSGVTRLAGLTAQELRAALCQPFSAMVASDNETLLNLMAAERITAEQIADLLPSEERRWDNVAVDITPMLAAAEFEARIHHVDQSGAAHDVGDDPAAAELVLFRDTTRHMEHYSARPRR